MKDELRRKYKALRAALSPEARSAADAALCQNTLALLGKYASFFIYLGFGSEADTHALIGRLLSVGKRVYLPRIEGDEMVAVRFSGDYAALKKNRLGISEPTGQAYSGDFDVVVAPLLAVNRRLYRLGYGGGYYDKFLSVGSALKVGLGYEFQLVDERFEDNWDVPLDMFIHDKGTVIL